MKIKRLSNGNVILVDSEGKFLAQLPAQSIISVNRRQEPELHISGTDQEILLSDIEELDIDGVVTPAPTDIDELMMKLVTDFFFKASSGGGSGEKTTSASELTSGTLADERLSNNVVLTTKVQTLTNKTLTSPVINNPTGITKANVGLANVDNTADSAKPVSSAQLTALNAKQATLVSGTTIKTINGTTLLGSGDLVISGGGGSPTTDASLLTSGTLADARLSSNVALNSTLDYRLAVNYMITKSGANTVATPRTGSGLPLHSGTNSADVFQLAVNSTLTGLGGKIVFHDSNFIFDKSVIVDGIDAQFDPRAQITIEGLGYQSRITQNTTGQNIFVFKDKISAIIRNMYLVVGNNGASAILGDDTGASASFGEISIYEGIIENVKVQHSGTQAAVWLKNYFNINVTHLDTISSTHHGLLLHGTSVTGQNYGNSHFSFIHANGGSAVGMAGIALISDVASHPINFNVFSSCFIGAGYYGLYLRGASGNTFAAVDIEYMSRNIKLEGGGAGVESGNNKFLSGYVYTNPNGIAIDCAEKTSGNFFRMYVQCDDATPTIINDLQQFRAGNDYDLILGYSGGANPIRNVASPSTTLVTIKKEFDGLIIKEGPYIIPNLTAIAQSIIPSTGNTRALGNTTNFFSELFVNTVSSNIVRPRTSGNALQLTSASGSAGVDFMINNTTTKVGSFASSGEFIAQQGGTFTTAASSQLSVNSTTKGSLPWPRMTVAQRAAIASPAVGLVGFATDFTTTDGSNGALQITTSAGLRTVAYTSDIATLKVDAAKTANYTLVLADAGKLIPMNLAGANTVTVPLNATVAYPIGTQILIDQRGAGQITITPTGAVALRSASGLKSRAQYSVITLIKIGTDEWLVSGDLTT